MEVWKIPKELHITLSDEDHRVLSNLKNENGLTWRDLLFKAYNIEPAKKNQ